MIDYRSRWQRQRRRRIQIRLGIVAAAIIFIAATIAIICGYRHGRVVWTHRPLNHGLPRLCTDGSRLYVAWADGNVKGIDPRTGKALGLVDFTRPVAFQSIPTIAGEQLIVGGDDFHIRAISTDAGQQIWDYQTGGAVRAQPVVDKRQILVGSDDGWLYCLDAEKGRGLWRVYCGSAIGARAAVTETRVVVGTADGKIVGIDRAAQRIAWSRSTEGPVLAPARPIGDGLVTVGCDDGKQYIVDAESGQVKFKVQMEGLIRREPIVEHHRLYLASNSGEMVAVDVPSQEVVWRRTIQAALTSGLTDKGQYLYAGTETGQIVAVDKDSGLVRHSWQIGAPITGSVIVSGEVVVAGLSDGRVVAISAPQK